ncbi:MAG: response regulator, partial [Lysobacteraceae bacterium]
TFMIRLPHTAPVVAAAPTQQSDGDNTGKPSVLLIEDNEDGREMMATMLAAHGFPVATAADGLLGVAAALEACPAAALVDIGLPGIDGYEVARRLRHDPATRGIRLIALTGYGLAEDHRRVMEAGFDQHLVKPVSMEQLIEALAPAAVQADAA